MTPNDFIAKWRNGGDERRDFQSFFDDLCRLLEHPTPREADPGHTWFTYEYGASKTTGGQGWADAWKRGFFGFEAKGTGRSLDAAYAQLKMYADALHNPPLLIVSDLQRFEIHTNFTNAVKEVHRFTVEDLANHATRRLLQDAFHDPERLRPGLTRQDITQEAAAKFAALAQRLRDRGHAPRSVANFLNRLLFCMFAEDIGLLPEQVFTKLVRSVQQRPEQFESRAAGLFAAMKDGGDFALTTIEWFNGGLFEDAETLPLDREDLVVLLEASNLDWAEIDPTIFGTLFERGLDPNKRSQLGAHYTDPETIQKIIVPVVVEPLLAEWEGVKDRVERALSRSTAKTKVPKAAQQAFNAFLERLRNFRVLDPACGSGNFLFLALRALKDLEHRVIWEGESLGLGRQAPSVGPANVLGIEINEYAAELARLTVWIGEIQWMIQNGYGVRRDPILQALGGISTRDALVDADGARAEWPSVDVIIGNPPFIGGRRLQAELGEEYVTTLRRSYAGDVPDGADFVAFWFEKARAAILGGRAHRAGFVATQAIRAGQSRLVLQAISESMDIAVAWQNEPWVNEGASLRVSIACFGMGFVRRALDGEPVSSIGPDLTSGDRGFDLTKASKLASNQGVAFQGVIPRGAFVIEQPLAQLWLQSSGNPNGRSNSEVLVPYINASDVVRRPTHKRCLDFGSASESEAAMFEEPFAYARANIFPDRQRTKQATSRELWWHHWCPRPEMKAALLGMDRYIATPRVAKHRIFVWVPGSVLSDSRLYVIARDDDTTFGLLHCRIHEVWSVATASRHGVGNDPTYNAASCFETFPFPARLTLDTAAAEYADDPHAIAIAAAATALTDARDRWLNPPEWVDWVQTPEEAAAGFPARPTAKPGHEDDLKKRTLTSLYNARPAWLANLHDALDQAVAAAYGWPWPMSDDEILRRLFELNQARAG